MMPYLEKIGGDATRQLQNRVLAELKTTFATSYARELSLADVLRIAEVNRYTRKATGEEVLIAPQNGLGNGWAAGESRSPQSVGGR